MESKPAHGKKKGAIRTVKALCVNWMASRLLVTLMLVVSPLTAVAEAKIEAELKSGHQSTPGAIQKPTPETTTRFQQRYTINLPHQTVAESLNDLARQTGAQFLFPFQLAQSKAANPVKGHFTLLQATQQLLQHTGLKSDLVDGVLTISLINCEQAEIGCDLNNLHGNESEKGKRMNTNKRKTLLATFVTMFASGVTVQAAAQNEFGEQASSQTTLDEIVVTAQKREQNLSDTALAISAISGEGLAARGAEGGYDLQFSIPSLGIGESTVGPAQVTIRGVGMENTFLGGDPGVPVHIDGHYIQDSTYILQDFMDIERVEVLRGPQGTLYGRNAIGGSINIITKQPSEDFFATASIDVGNYNKRLFQAVVNGVLTEKMSGRLVVADENRDGYIENISSIGGQDLLNSNYTSARGALKYELNDDISFILSGYHFDDSGNTSVTRTVTENPTDTLSGFLNYFVLNSAEANPTVSDPRKVRFNADEDSFNVSKGMGFDVNWDLDNVRLRALSSYNDSKSSFLVDNDGSDAVIFHDDFSRAHQTFSQELQILSDVSSHSQWIVGVFYYDEKSDASEIFDVDSFFVDDGSKTTSDILYDMDSTAMGVFGQIDYPITEKLELVGGLRYNKDKKVYLGSVDIPDFAFTVALEQTDKWEEITGKLGINYQLESGLLYASYTTGYKAGGFNSLQPSYDPETVKAYEAGIKGLWFDQTVQASINGFYYDYTDKQEFERNPFLGLAFITNAGAATVYGLEFEGLAQVSSRFKVDGSIAYLNAEYDQFISEDGINPGLQDVSGNQLPRSPEWKVHLGLEYEWAVNNIGRLFARLDTVWVDEQFSSPFNRQDRDFMDSYQRTNVRLNWESQDGQWLGSLYVQNLEDDDVVSNLFDAASVNGLPVPIYGQYFAPRTYGVKITRNF